MFSGLALSIWLPSLFLMWGEMWGQAEKGWGSTQSGEPMKPGSHVGWGEAQPSDKVSG